MEGKEIDLDLENLNYWDVLKILAQKFWYKLTNQFIKIIKNNK